MENKIGISLEKGINTVFVQFNEERKFIKYDFKDRFSKEFEIKLRNILLEVERDYENVTSEIAFRISCEGIKNHKTPEYENVMINLGENAKYNDDKIIIMPKGNYLTMFFDDSYVDSGKYYDEIINYIEESKIKTIGDFNEIYIMTRVGTSGKIKSLGQIEILIE